MTVRYGGATAYERDQKRERARERRKRANVIAQRPNGKLLPTDTSVRWEGITPPLVEPLIAANEVQSLTLMTNERGRPHKLVVITKDGRQDEFPLKGGDDARVLRRIGQILGMDRECSGNCATYTKPRRGYAVDNKIWKLNRIIHATGSTRTEFRYSGGKIRHLQVSTVLLNLLMWIFVRRTQRTLWASKPSLSSTRLEYDVVFE
jgi:hypothetical protein